MKILTGGCEPLVRTSSEFLDIPLYVNKKKPTQRIGFFLCLKIQSKNYLLNFEYLVLNLSILPAVSTNLALPV